MNPATRPRGKKNTTAAGLPNQQKYIHTPKKKLTRNPKTGGLEVFFPFSRRHFVGFHVSFRVSKNGCEFVKKDLSTSITVQKNLNN